MKSISNYLFLLLCILFFSKATAQIGNYTFEQGLMSKQLEDHDYGCSGCYYKVGNTYSTWNPEVESIYYKDTIFIYNGSTMRQSPITLAGNGFPVGFKFIYDKDTITKVACSSNGYLKLGKQNESPFIIFRDTTTDNFLHPDATISSYNKNTIIALFRDTSKNNSRSYTRVDLGYLGFPGKRVFFYNANYNLIFNSNFSVILNQIFSNIELHENTNIIKIIRDPYNTTYTDTAIQKSICGLIGNSGQITTQDAHFRKVKKNYSTFLTSERDYTLDTLMEVCNKTVYKPTFYDTTLYYQFSPPFRFEQPNCQEVYIITTSKLDSNFVYSGTRIHFNKNYYDQFFHYHYNELNYGPYYSFLAGKTNVNRALNIGWTGGNPLDTTYRYDVYLDTDNPPLSKIGSDIHPHSYLLDLAPLSANQRYYYKVVAKNKMGNTNSCPANWFETGNKFMYCNNMGGFRDSLGFGIWEIGPATRSFRGLKSIKMSSINFTRGVINPEIYYFPEAAPYSTTLQRTKKYAIQVKQMFVSGTGSNPLGGAVIYVDMNRNGVFDSAEVIYKKTFYEGAPDHQTINDSIAIPDSIPLGKTWMRVGWQYTSELDAFNKNDACQLRESFDFIVTITAQPKCDSFTINPKITNVACYGQTNGKIALNIKGGTPPYAIAWADNATNHDTTRIVKKGQYNCTITDNKGCLLWTDLIEITQPAPLHADTLVSQPTVSNPHGGSIYVTTTGGTAPYHYTWSTGNPNDTFAYLNNLDSGRYTVTVTDKNGCTQIINTIKINKVVSTGIMNPQLANLIRIYPNPAKDKLQLQIKNLNTVHCILYDLGGKRIQTEKLKSGSNVIDVSNLASGIYHLYFETEQGNYEEQLAVQRE